MWQASLKHMWQAHHHQTLTEAAVFIKDYYLSLLLVCVFLYPPRVCTVTDINLLFIYIFYVLFKHASLFYLGHLNQYNSNIYAVYLIQYLSGLMLGHSITLIFLFFSHCEVLFVVDHLDERLSHLLSFRYLKP